MPPPIGGPRPVPVIAPHWLMTWRNTARAANAAGRAVPGLVPPVFASPAPAPGPRNFNGPFPTAFPGVAGAALPNAGANHGGDLRVLPSLACVHVGFRKIHRTQNNPFDWQVVYAKPGGANMDRLVLKAYNYNYLLQPVRGRKRKTGTHWRVRNEDMIWNANFQPLTQAQRVAAVVNEIVVWDGANPGDYGLHGAFRNALRAQFRVNAAAGAAILGPIAF